MGLADLAGNVVGGVVGGLIGGHDSDSTSTTEVQVPDWLQEYYRGQNGRVGTYPMAEATYLNNMDQGYQGMSPEQKVTYQREIERLQSNPNADIYNNLGMNLLGQPQNPQASPQNPQASPQNPQASPAGGGYHVSDSVLDAHNVPQDWRNQPIGMMKPNADGSGGSPLWVRPDSFNQDGYLWNKANHANSINFQGRNDWDSDSVLAEMTRTGLTPWEHYQKYNSYDPNLHDSSFQREDYDWQRYDPQAPPQNSPVRQYNTSNPIPDGMRPPAPQNPQAPPQNPQSPLAGADQGAISNSVNTLMQGRVDPNNINAMLNQYANRAMQGYGDMLQDTGKMWNQEINPSIRQGAIVNGAYGGSRQGIAEGTALSNLNDNLTRNARDISQSILDSGQGLYGQANENALNRQLGATQFGDQMNRGNFNTGVNLLNQGNNANRQDFSDTASIWDSFNQNNQNAQQFDWNQLNNYSNLINGNNFTGQSTTVNNPGGTVSGVGYGMNIANGLTQAFNTPSSTVYTNPGGYTGWGANSTTMTANGNTGNGTIWRP